MHQHVGAGAPRPGAIARRRYRRRGRSCGPGGARPAPDPGAPLGPSRRAERDRTRARARARAAARVTGSNTPGRSVLVQDVAECRAAVGDRHGGDPVPVAREHVARRELDQLRARSSRDRPAQRQAQQLAQPGRPVNRQRPLAAAQVEGLQQPGQAEPVIGVEVGQEDLGQVGQADRARPADAGSPRRSRTGSDRPPDARARAGSPRRAVGTEPAVPAKNIERSMREQSVSPSVDQLEAAPSAVRIARTTPMVCARRGGARWGCRG